MNVLTLVSIRSIRSRRASFSCKENFSSFLFLRSNLLRKISSLDPDYPERFPLNSPYPSTLDRYPMNSRHPTISSNHARDIAMRKRWSRFPRLKCPHSRRKERMVFASCFLGQKSLHPALFRSYGAIDPHLIVNAQCSDWIDSISDEFLPNLFAVDECEFLQRTKLLIETTFSHSRLPRSSIVCCKFLSWLSHNSFALFRRCTRNRSANWWASTRRLLCSVHICSSD